MKHAGKWKLDNFPSIPKELHGATLGLLTLEQLAALPPATPIINIIGRKSSAGKEAGRRQDVRGGLTAWGVVLP